MELNRNRRLSKAHVNALEESGALDEFAEFDGSDSSEVALALRSGLVTLDDLPDFNWEDYAE